MSEAAMFANSLTPEMRLPSSASVKVLTDRRVKQTTLAWPSRARIKSEGPHGKLPVSKVNPAASVCHDAIEISDSDDDTDLTQPGNHWTHLFLDETGVWRACEQLEVKADGHVVLRFEGKHKTQRHPVIRLYEPSLVDTIRVPIHSANQQPGFNLLGGDGEQNTSPRGNCPPTGNLEVLNCLPANVSSLPRPTDRFWLPCVNQHFNPYTADLSALNAGMRLCTWCGVPTASWCDLCENSFVDPRTSFAGRPVCHAHEAIFGGCAVCCPLPGGRPPGGGNGHEPEKDPSNQNHRSSGPLPETEVLQDPQPPLGTSSDQAPSSLNDHSGAHETLGISSRVIPSNLNNPTGALQAQSLGRLPKTVAGLAETNNSRTADDQSFTHLFLSLDDNIWRPCRDPVKLDPEITRLTFRCGVKDKYMPTLIAFRPDLCDQSASAYHFMPATIAPEDEDAEHLRWKILCQTFGAPPPNPSIVNAEASNAIATWRHSQRVAKAKPVRLLGRIGRRIVRAAAALALSSWQWACRHFRSGLPAGSR